MFVPRNRLQLSITTTPVDLAVGGLGVLTPISWDTVDRNDQYAVAALTPPVTSFTILKPAWYTLAYNINWKALVNDKMKIEIHVRKNGVFVPGTYSHSWNDEINDESNNSCPQIGVALIAGDVIDVVSMLEPDSNLGTTETEVNECTFLLGEA